MSEMYDPTWPAPTPRDELLARVVTRGRRIQMINRLIVAVVVAGVVSAAAVGVALGTSRTVDLFGAEASSATVGGDGDGDDGVEYRSCPNGAVLGRLRGGDRVYLTGRDDSEDWVEVRSPVDQVERVWVRAELVDPDAAVDLPVVGCDGADLTAAGPGVMTTTTSTTIEGEELPPEETTTTTAPGPGPTPTTQPGPGPTTPTTQPGPGPTTTLPPPPAPPVIGTISRSQTTIWEADFPGQCSLYGGPVTSTISAIIPSATSATMSWSVAGSQGSKPMQRSGSTFSAVFGEFPESTVPYSPPWYATATITIVATGPDGSDQRSTSIRVDDCTFG